MLTQETSAYSEEPSLTVSSSTIPRVQQTSDRARSKQRDILNNQARETNTIVCFNQEAKLFLSTFYADDCSRKSIRDRGR